MVFSFIIPYLLLRSVADAFPFIVQSQSSVGANLTDAGLDAPSNAAINCFPPQEASFAPASCSSIFTQFRSFPNWAATQQFLEHVRPRIVPDDPATTPPFHFIDEGGECTMVLVARRSDLSDRFSWEEVARLGLEIARRCPRHGGYSFIGEARRWSVRVSSSFSEHSLAATNESMPGIMVTENRRSLLQTTSSLVISPNSHQLNASSINCWDNIDFINLPACGDIFRTLADLPDYGDIQTFEEGVGPRLEDTTPPFLFQRNRGARKSCSLILQSDARGRTERLSWRQIVRASQAIIFQCGNAGPGGWTLIGADHKWFLSLSRFDLL